MAGNSTETMSKHGVVGIWDLDATRADLQRRTLQDQIVPSVQRSFGFVAGYWMQDTAEGKSYSVIVLESADAAEQFLAFVEGSAANQDTAGIRPELLKVVEMVAESHRHACGEPRLATGRR